MARVFVSYSSKDANVADLVVSTVEKRGHACWIAPRDILPGTEWGEAIIKGINQAEVFVLVFSQHANTSPQILREVERAVNRGIPIIPFRIDEVLPQGSLEYFMSVPHWFDAITPPMEAHADKLAHVISKLEADPEASSEYLTAPPDRAETSLWNTGMARAVAGGVGLAILVLTGWLAGIAPPGTPSGWLAALVAISVALLIGASGQSGLFAKRIVRAALVLLLLCAAGTYGWAHSNFVIEGLAGEAIIRGTTCTPDAALVYVDECPDLPSEAIIDAAYDETLLWTSASIARSALILSLSWVIIAAAAAALVAGWLGSPRQSKKTG